MTDEERNYLEISNNWNFSSEFRVWRFVCYLALGIETTDADLWLTDIVNHNFPELPSDR